MGFLTGLFGDNAYLTAALALGIVLVLIVLAVWLVKLMSQATTTARAGRNRRLTVVDSVMLDQRRQAILLRRDDVEHLIVTGGPQDLLVEADIEAPRPAAYSRPVRRPAAEPAAQSLAQPAPLPEARPAPAAPQPRPSLRHTALLRPDAPNGPEIHNGEANGADSATSVRTRPGQARLEARRGDTDNQSQRIEPQAGYRRDQAG